MMTNRRDVVTYGFGGLAAAVGVSGVTGASPGKGGGEGPKGKAAQVNFLDQTAEPDDQDEIEVTVKQTFLPDGGFVVIHKDGEPFGGVVGNSEPLLPGTHVDATVDGVSADAVEEGDDDGDPELVAMPHRNTGDDGYEFPNKNDDGELLDPPYFKKGSPIIDSAVVTVED